MSTFTASMAIWLALQVFLTAVNVVTYRRRETTRQHVVRLAFLAVELLFFAWALLLVWMAR